jgi:hypothetical protein
VQEVRTNTLKHSRKFKKSFAEWLWVHPIYLFVVIIINIISININSHPFLIQLFTSLTGKLELCVVYPTAVIHVSADVNKEPNVEQKTQKTFLTIFFSIFVYRLILRVHFIYNIWGAVYTHKVSTLPLKEKLKVNVIGKALMCVSCNFNCTLYTTTVQVQRKYSHILNCPLHKTTALTMLLPPFLMPKKDT